MSYRSKSADETKALAKALLKDYPEHRVWLLYGNLGAGKTTLIKGLGEALGIQAIQIKSPTYTLVNEYENLTHYDLYRIETMDELTLELLEEHLAAGKRTVIEWPEQMENTLTVPHLKIRLTHVNEDERDITVEVIGRAK